MSATCETNLVTLLAAGLVPESLAGLVRDVANVEPQAAASLAPDVTGDASVGETLSRSDVAITVLEVDWEPDTSDALFQPAEGNAHVAILVRYEAPRRWRHLQLVLLECTR